MNKWYRRTIYSFAVLVVIIFAYAVVYHYGMLYLEGESKTFLQSLEVVVQTFTTTGFGEDAPWSSDLMNVLVITMDLTGVALIFLALPVLIFPLFEEALSTTVPTSVEDDLADHVVVCADTPRAEVLIDELDSWDVEYVLVEPDREAATERYESGYRVVHDDPTTVSGLESANLADARAIVADVDDDVDASIVLTAQEVSEDVQIVSVVEDPDQRRYHELAGADAVLSPRPLLGESLAAKVTTGVRAEFEDAVAIDGDLQIAELPVGAGSPLEGRTIAESGIREATGVNVIGAWFCGEFESPPSPETTIDRGTVLLVTGRPDQLADLREQASASIRQFDGGRVLIAGYGQVGQRVAEMLDEQGVPHTTVDAVDRDGVDVVGDVTDPETLEAARIHDARTVLLAIPDDTASEFATLVVRDLSPDTEIVARVEQAESVQKMYRAGADYVLALETITGRMIASTVLEDEDVIAFDTQIEVVRTTAPGMTGQTLQEADVRSRTGCTVVAVERDGAVHTDLGSEFRIESGDELVVVGTDEGTNRFTEQYR
ncbi:potassium channel family protein [Halapricum desulfuricans]|uniref:K+ transport system, NAD-binding component fusedto Ion channel n=1 Tax=Halapricum desulfuricans TaxID=2841257 RepID=A0A897N8T3_9EURY|nr:NAD-binding protein [Halapricum desulfuricans]QSG08688.1 K+ transport system, NAD-binding component fusedto Ion channel [Halapricum desulfuricans]